MPENPPRRNVLVPITVCILALVVIGAWVASGRNGRAPLVVYCAHDAVYAESVLRRFEKESGIPLAIRFDSEATKSLGLVEQLLREKEAPRCDVFWNNQALGTQRLKEAGVLEPYKGPGYDRIPAAFKDPEGCWTGFGARLRVYIINTEKMPATETAVEEKLSGDLSRVAMAKPLYGTTFVHYSAIWKMLGEKELKRMHADWRARNVVETVGNAQNKNLVAEGVCDLGWTDTDDFFEAKDKGEPVEMLPIRIAGGRTICSPNTVALIKGSGRAEDGRRLVEYLLSEESEVEMANASSRQVPLGPVDESRIPEEVRRLKGWAADACPLSDVMQAAPACLDWLKSEYVQ
jgi:iron(III) transport system substrate-binding protein